MARDPLDHPDAAIRKVYAYVAYRVGSGVLAEDVTSATIERAVRYRSTYRPDAGSPSAWLIGIAANVLADAVRERSRELAVDPAELPEQASEGFESIVVERDELRRAVASLDERSRELVALRYGADLTTKEIAALLDMTTGAVDVAVHRALARLRATMTEVAEQVSPTIDSSDHGAKGPGPTTGSFSVEQRRG